MAEPRLTRQSAEQLARLVSEQGGEQLSIRRRQIDSPHRYSIERHNLYDERITHPLSFGPDFTRSRDRFTAAEATLILAGIAYGLGLAPGPDKE